MLEATDLPSDQIQDVVFVGGQSDMPGNLPGQNPNATNVDSKVTVEFFEARTRQHGRALMGIATTQHLVEGVPRENQFVMPLVEGDYPGFGVATRSFEDPQVAEEFYGDKSDLSEVARALGLSFKRIETKDQLRTVAFMLAEPVDINERLGALGVTDREVELYEGAIAPVRTALEYVARGKILAATDKHVTFHDRLVHLVAQVVTAPSVWKALGKRCQDLLADEKATDQDLVAFMDQIENGLTGLAFVLADADIAKEDKATYLYGLLRGFSFDYTESRQFAQDTVDWTEQLKLKAHEILHR